MKSVAKLVWNLFRLALAVGFCALIVVTGWFIIHGQLDVASVTSALMSVMFFSINVANFRQYRWEKSGVGARAVVLAPLFLSLSALVAASTLGATFGFSALGTVVVFWFLVTRRRPDLASSKVPARLLITEQGVRRMYANMELDAIDWDDVVRVAVSTECETAIPDDLFYFLEGDDEQRCVVPNRYARELMPRLQRLSGFDNEGLVEAALDESGDDKVIWEGSAGQARICGVDDR